MINIERLMQNLDNIGNIGCDIKGGITRTAFSPAYFGALFQLKKLAEQSGYSVLQDKIGNLFITYNPNESDKFIMLGSHLDTVRNGGLYDGALGVMAGLEVLDSIREQALPLQHGLILTVFNAEEGGEMGGTFGSRAITGAIDLTDPHLSDRLSQHVLTTEDVSMSEWDFSNIIAFIELHIEQGPYLADNGYDIGVVDGIVGIYRYDFHLYGTSNHAGTTPMVGRDDPILKMNAFIQHLHDVSLHYEHPFVMTVGNIKVNPGLYSVIPNEVILQVELRDINTDNLDEFIQSMEEYLGDNVENFDIIKNVEKSATIMNPSIVNIIEEAAIQGQNKQIVMSSGAGHDSSSMSRKVPTGMIFVPSVGGISHTPDEFTNKEQIKKGTDTLLRAILNLDKSGSVNNEKI